MQQDLEFSKWYDGSIEKLHMPLTEATIAQAIEIGIKEVKQRRTRERRSIRESIIPAFLSFSFFFSKLYLYRE